MFQEKSVRSRHSLGQIITLKSFMTLKYMIKIIMHQYHAINTKAIINIKSIRIASIVFFRKEMYRLTLK